MSNKQILQLILEAALDEVTVDFIALNAFQKYKINRDEFDRIVEAAIENNNVRIETESLYDASTGAYVRSDHFLSTDSTILALEVL